MSHKGLFARKDPHWRADMGAHMAGIAFMVWSESQMDIGARRRNTAIRHSLVTDLAPLDDLSCLPPKNHMAFLAGLAHHPA